MAEIIKPGQAWQNLQDLAKAEAENKRGPTPQPYLRFVQSGHLALIGIWQVEAHFVEAGGSFRIHFDRFGGQLGQVNVELPPGSTPVSRETWEVQFVEGKTHPFWRLNGQDLTPERLAQKVIEHLKDYYDKVRLASVGVGQ